MIGLCSKTYIVRKVRTNKPSLARLADHRILLRSMKRKRPCLKPRIRNEFKFGSKGVSKRLLKAPMVKFRRVLKTSVAQSGFNRGFRPRNNTIYTYTQEKNGFSYFYCKRKVTYDSIHTEPLDITLCPVPPEDDQ